MLLFLCLVNEAGAQPLTPSPSIETYDSDDTLYVSFESDLDFREEDNERTLSEDHPGGWSTTNFRFQQLPHCSNVQIISIQPRLIPRIEDVKHSFAWKRTMVESFKARRKALRRPPQTPVCINCLTDLFIHSISGTNFSQTILILLICFRLYYK